MQYIYKYKNQQKKSSVSQFQMFVLNFYWKKHIYITASIISYKILDFILTDLWRHAVRGF